MASVTDVPLSGDVGGVTGIVGLSAPSHSPTDLVSLVNRFVAGSNKVWPNRMRARIEMDWAACSSPAPRRTS